MKLLIAVFACLAIANAYVPDTTIDWANVKHRDLKVPLPFGLEDLVFTERIIGGQDAEPNEHPYMAGLVITASDGTYFCGGSVISARDIITAAHCLVGASQVHVILGAHIITALEATQQRYYTTEYTIHAGWDPELFLNDVAIVRLEQNIILNDYVGVIALPTYHDVSETFAGYEAVLSGWGVVHPDDAVVSEILQNISKLVIGNFTCNLSFLGGINDSHICTSGEGGIGACYGDSGNPLTIDNKLIGIVSYALEHSCAIQWPSVYTRATYFLDWIVAHSDAHVS